MTRSEELRNERVGVITKMRELNEKAEKENRDLNTEERSQYDKMKADVIALKQRFERIESQETLERELQESAGRVVTPGTSRSDGNEDGQGEEKKRSDPTNTPEYKRAFEAFMRRGVNSLSDEQKRALEAGVAAEGGHTVPTDTSSVVVKELQRGSVMRQAGARVLATSRDTDIPVAGIVSGTWEPEEDPFGGGADTDPTFTAFNAGARKYTVGTKASEELISDSAVDIAQLITDLFVEAWVQASDDGYVNGLGPASNQPTGILADGTVKLVAAVNSFTATELRQHFFSVPQQYRRDPSCAWIASDEFISRVASLSADNNQEFLWVPGLREGESDRLMGKPIFSSAAVPTTFQANAKVAVVGAMRFYQIVDRIRQAGVKRLNELFATTGQIGFIGSWRTDGKLLLPNAVRVMQMAAA